MTRKRVCIIYMGNQRDPGACEIYRGNQPASMLNKYSNRWEANWLYFGDLVVVFRYAGPEAIVEMVKGYDLFVFPRMYIPNEDFMNMRVTYSRLFQLLRNMGKRLVYETDDDYTNAHRYVVEGDAMEVASWCDAMTVTTPLLGKTMQREAKRPYHILPNCLDPVLWDNPAIPPARSKNEGKIIIGLTGSPTHKTDWEVLEAPIRAIAEEHGDRVEFWVMGFHPDYLNNVPNLEFIPALPYTHYPRVIRGCDIIIAAVDPHDGFNLGKSPIKAVEGMAGRRELHGRSAGAAVIATRNPVYSLVIKDGETGRLTEHTSDAWHQNLSELVLNDGLRHRLQINGYKAAWKRYNATREYVQWERVYDSILKMPPNSIYLPTLEEEGVQS